MDGWNVARYKNFNETPLNASETFPGTAAGTWGAKIFFERFMGSVWVDWF
jgi:hypothetical protein